MNYEEGLQGKSSGKRSIMSMVHGSGIMINGRTGNDHYEQQQQQQHGIGNINQFKNQSNHHQQQQRQVSTNVIATYLDQFSDNEFEMSEMREKLFRLVSKVPIHVESVPSESSLYLSAEKDLYNNHTSSTNQHQQQQRRFDSREPILIKYYNERSLNELIELHFACSLNSRRPQPVSNQHGEQPTTTANVGSVFDYQQASAIDHHNHHHQLQQQLYAATNSLNNSNIDFVQQQQFHNSSCDQFICLNGSANDEHQFYRHQYCAGQQLECPCVAIDHHQQTQAQPTISAIKFKLGNAKVQNGSSQSAEFKIKQQRPSGDKSPSHKRKDEMNPLFVCGSTNNSSKKMKSRHVKTNHHHTQKTQTSSPAALIPERLGKELTGPIVVPLNSHDVDLQPVNVDAHESPPSTFDNTLPANYTNQQHHHNSGQQQQQQSQAAAMNVYTNETIHQDNSRQHCAHSQVTMNHISIASQHGPQVTTVGGDPLLLDQAANIQANYHEHQLPALSVNSNNIHQQEVANCLQNGLELTQGCAQMLAEHQTGSNWISCELELGEQSYFHKFNQHPSSFHQQQQQQTFWPDQQYHFIESQHQQTNSGSIGMIETNRLQQQQQHQYEAQLENKITRQQFYFLDSAAGQTNSDCQLYSTAAAATTAAATATVPIEFSGNPAMALANYSS